MWVWMVVASSGCNRSSGGRKGSRIVGVRGRDSPVAQCRLHTCASLVHVMWCGAWVLQCACGMGLHVDCQKLPPSHIPQTPCSTHPEVPTRFRQYTVPDVQL
jgi:hypothetical protein